MIRLFTRILLWFVPTVLVSMSNRNTPQRRTVRGVGYQFVRSFEEAVA